VTRSCLTCGARPMLENSSAFSKSWSRAANFGFSRELLMVSELSGPATGFGAGTRWSLTPEIVAMLKPLRGRLRQGHRQPPRHEASPAQRTEQSACLPPRLPSEAHYVRSPELAGLTGQLPKSSGGASSRLANGFPRSLLRRGAMQLTEAVAVQDKGTFTSGEDRVVVIGSGWLFASGISHYTFRLSSALAKEYPVSTLLMRRLVPRRLYPGRNHVGAPVASAVYPAEVPVYDGVDWYWGRSLTDALRYLDRQHPTVLILQWWTGAVLHTYLRLARYAAQHGARVILEWHEGQDPGEATLPGARRYVRMLMPRLLSLVDAHVVHSSYDLRAITASYSLGNAIVRVMPHGPYDHLAHAAPVAVDPAAAGAPLRVLYLGVVRPFKGVEDLIAAFSSLDRDQASRFRLSVVGETWEGWKAPDQAIARSPHADLIERVDRYVTDAELKAYFEQADAVVLPYHRSSSSGPLHIAMSAGLPVVVTAVGGLVEAVQDYDGALLVPPRDPTALRDALLRLLEHRGRRYADPHSWQRTVDGYRALIHQLDQAEQKGTPQLGVSPASTGADSS
jgi:glycosyltransferase involved in cell wall biosynthesis